MLLLASVAFLLAAGAAVGWRGSLHFPRRQLAALTLQQNGARDPVDWRSYRARMAKANRGSHESDESDEWWVHELPAPEPGCVLLAQPHGLFPDQPHLHRAVVLVVLHDESQGTVGLLLGCGTNRTVGDVLRRTKWPQLTSFSSRPLWVGGDVVTQHAGLRVLTRRCDVPDSQEVLPGLYLCLPAAAARVVAIGAAFAEEFDFYAGACQWSPAGLAAELHAAIWLPVAASAAALRGPSLYFELMEGVGGQYAKQAWLARSAAEVDEWLNACAGVAAPLWDELARRCAAEPPRLKLGEAMVGVHSARYYRDNLTDVWACLDALAEQAAYIWFTRELDTQLTPLAEWPPKDPHRLGGIDGLPLDAKGRVPKRKVPKATIPLLRVVQAAQEFAYSQQNALLSLNLLLFEVIRYEARDRGKGVSVEQTSLPLLVRRGGGPANLFAMCVLYAELAGRLGVPLEVVLFAPPKVLRGRGPEFLLRLAGDEEQQELFVDVQAHGRLRTPHDLAAFMHEACPAAALRPAAMQSFVVPLSVGDACVQQLHELEWVCESAEQIAEAAFWRVQREMFIARRTAHEGGGG
ncbi:hypothetical protein AB1Y20_008367 [Prymnesium parvum]|uniref:Protein SirB1 N-terminal domain-containing protein n=1 Tax=Prymnesium parvum TaxID=97485 RepID=A0AB34IQV5_PRYPA